MIKKTYTLPSKRKVTLREIRTEEYIRIAELHSKAPARMFEELVKITVVAFDDVDVTASTINKLWSDLSAKDKELIKAAYGRINHASEEESKDFFDSEETEIVA